MKGNLLELFDAEVKPGLIDALNQVGAAPEKPLQDDLTIFHAAILGKLILNSRRKNGVESIKNHLSNWFQSGYQLEEMFDGLTEETSFTEIKNQGSQHLDFVFDEEVELLYDKIAQFISEKYSATRENVDHFFSIVASFTSALCSQIIHFDKLSEEQLRELLESNSEPVSLRYPELAQILDLRIQPEIHQPDLVSELTIQKVTTEPSREFTPEEKKVVRNSAGGNTAGNPTVIPSNDKEKPKDTAGKKAPEDKERFFKALWPWVILLILSAVALFFIKRYEINSIEPSVDSNFPFTATDTVAEVNNDTDLTGNVPSTSDDGNFLDSLVTHLKSDQNLTDTLRYMNSSIKFEDSSSVLTTNDSKELSSIVSLLLSYPNINMGIRLLYDSTYLSQNRAIANSRVHNLSNYFNAFGLTGSRYFITNSILPPHNYTTDTINNSSSDPSAPNTDERSEPDVELLFYQESPGTGDTIKIQ